MQNRDGHRPSQSRIKMILHENAKSRWSQTISIPNKNDYDINNINNKNINIKNGVILFI